MGWTRQEVLDVARSTGRPVVEAWSAHNAGQMGTVLGPMLHHTGSGWTYPTNIAPTLRTVREGRSDLQNALCMYYIDYEGVIYCITEKIAWHAGGGSWQGVTDGNGHFAGIEAESDGKQWTKATTAAYKRLAAAILRKTGNTVAYAPRHADYALPKGRKTDFSGMDPAGFLADVNADLAGNPTSGDFLMSLTDAQQAELATAVGRIEYALMTFVKPSTDYIPAMANSTSKLEWGVLDETQGLRVAVSGLYAKLAEVGTGRITAADIAAAIPDGIAADVADELQRRLAS